MYFFKIFLIVLMKILGLFTKKSDYFYWYLKLFYLSILIVRITFFQKKSQLFKSFY
jgi:hypothetical protein